MNLNYPTISLENLEVLQIDDMISGCFLHWLHKMNSYTMVILQTFFGVPKREAVTSMKCNYNLQVIHTIVHPSQ